MTKNFPRVAIVCDWLTNFSGAEQVIKSFVNVFPEAEIFTTVYNKDTLNKINFKNKIHASYLQKLPKFIKNKHQILLPFLPKAIESLDLSKFNIILSSNSFIAKGVITNINQLHICYCHTPTRYIWNNWQEYLKNFPINKILKTFLPLYFYKLRSWDYLSSKRPDFFISNSSYISSMIKKIYNRDSVIIHPPVDTNFFNYKKTEKDDYFLSFGRLVTQKKIDLLIRVFKKNPHYKLFIVGKGNKEKSLKSLADNSNNIKFLGFLPKKDILNVIRKSKALLFPQVEDAGITALEFLNCGVPVIAYKKGGILDFVNDKNGVFFQKQDEKNLKRAIEIFEKKEFNSSQISHNAKKYDTKNFEEKIKNFVLEKYNDFKKDQDF